MEQFPERKVIQATALTEDQYQALKSLVISYFEADFRFFPVAALRDGDRIELEKRFGGSPRK